MDVDEKMMETTGGYIVDLVRLGIAGVNVLGVLILFVGALIMWKKADHRYDVPLPGLTKNEQKSVLDYMCKSSTRAAWFCVVAAVLMVPITIGVVLFSYMKNVGKP